MVKHTPIGATEPRALRGKPTEGPQTDPLASPIRNARDCQHSFYQTAERFKKPAARIDTGYERRLRHLETSEKRDARDGDAPVADDAVVALG